MRGVWGVVVVALMVVPPGAQAEDLSSAPQPFRYDPRGRRDPFVALVRDGRLTGTAAQSARQESQHPVLVGILWDAGGRSIALINDEEVTLGSRISGYEVTEIRPDAVVLSDGKESLVLQITFDQPPATTSKKASVKGGEGS